jgi:hypothetical protein
MQNLPAPILPAIIPQLLATPILSRAAIIPHPLPLQEIPMPAIIPELLHHGRPMSSPPIPGETPATRNVRLTSARRRSNRLPSKLFACSLTMPEFASAHFGSRSLKSNIGSMTVKCNFCNALKFKGEPDGLCCQEGAVSLPLPRLPPQPLWDLFNGSHQHSNFFRENIRAINQALSFASLKANQDRLPPG